MANRKLSASANSQSESFFEKVESFFEIVESFFEKVESFFEKIESFFEKMESFFEKVESFFEKIESFFEILVECDRFTLQIMAICQRTSLSWHICHYLSGIRPIFILWFHILLQNLFF